jgi:hypothetical protein
MQVIGQRVEQENYGKKIESIQDPAEDSRGNGKSPAWYLRLSCRRLWVICDKHGQTSWLVLYLPLFFCSVIPAGNDRKKGKDGQRVQKENTPAEMTISFPFYLPHQLGS